MLIYPLIYRSRYGMGLRRLLHGRRNTRSDRTTPHSCNRTNSSHGAFRVSSVPFFTLASAACLANITLYNISGLDTVALLLVWLFVPGTERHIITMEEMNYVFGVATRKHMRYQRDEVGPWFYHRYVRMRDVKDPEPLYHYARMSDAANGH